MGPTEALVGLGDLLAQAAEGARPDDYLADVATLRQAAAHLQELTAHLLDRDEPNGSAALAAELGQVRHDLGNRLNQVVGMVQLLQIQEEALFGAFLPDLKKILDQCRACEARLLSLREGRRNAPSGMSEEEVAQVLAQIQPIDDLAPGLSCPGGTVLIADDDPVNREVLRRVLEHQGHCVAEAGGGGEALRVLQQRAYDVLLLDILMPGMNGFQVLQQLRESGALRRTAVIVISALDEVHSLVRCLEAGAEDYLTKPVDKALLRARINACLQKRRQRARELEQFFPPEVVAGLLDQPEKLQTGRSAEVTTLFCDVRGFSRISERLRETPDKMVAWLGAVMEALDECVLRHGGVLIDFIGDELLAMWGAPDPQEDHARRACQAALDMLGSVARLSDDWQGVVGEPTCVGVGINSGPVSVGNTGTRRRFKYGPVGNTVNLASRIQGATKHLGARVLISESTKAQLGGGFAVRRLARLQVVNIREPVTVYELAPPGQAGWDELKRGYEEALGLYEKGPEHLQEAARVLGSQVTSCGLAGPNLFLLTRILSAMQDRATWSATCVLPGK
jgi:adenylate cyclase